MSKKSARKEKGSWLFLLLVTWYYISHSWLLKSRHRTPPVWRPLLMHKAMNAEATDLIDLPVGIDTMKRPQIQGVSTLSGMARRSQMGSARWNLSHSCLSWGFSFSVHDVWTVNSLNLKSHWRKKKKTRLCWFSVQFYNSIFASHE